MNWEITTFIAYFVILLGVALVFYFNGTNKKFGGLLPRRALHGPLGSPPCPRRRPICPRGC